MFCSKVFWCEACDALEVVEGLNISTRRINTSPKRTSEDGEGRCKVESCSVEEDEAATKDFIGVSVANTVMLSLVRFYTFV